MSGPEDPREAASPQGGDTTASKGSLATVRVTTSRRARSTIALFLAGPVIWSLHFLLVYFVVEVGCTGGGEGLDVFAPPVPRTVTLAATAVAAVACLVITIASYRRWRSDRPERADRTDLTPAEGVAPLAFVGSLLALLGFITVLFVGLPALVLPACLP